MWSGNNVDRVVNNMEKKIWTLMDKCMPLKSVRLSSRDPVWMTPLVKSMLRAKSRISCNNVERHKVINSRISEEISANRKNPRLVIGRREWWEIADLVSQRRNSTYVNLDSDSLNDLNDFFALLCSDDNYVPPSDVVIVPDVEIPQITERQVWNILAKLNRTATGPDERGRYNCKFSEHVKLKLTKANKCLHILRTLRKELFSQKKIDHLFKTLVLPILTNGLAVYGASDSDLNVIQSFFRQVP